MSDIAVRAGVSRYTVSKILNGDCSVRQLTREKVLALCDTLGFVPNSSAVTLVSGHSNIIGMMVPYITDGFYSELIEIAEKYASSHGMTLAYQSSYNDPEIEAKIIRSFIGMKIAALLAVPVVTSPNLLVHQQAAANFPVIYLDRAISGSACCILNDNEASSRMMTEHLLTHSPEVAFIDSFYGDANQTALDRRRGYLAALAAHGKKPFILDNTHSHEKQDNERFGYENFSAYLKTHAKPPKALFCVTDAVALGAMRALRDAGFTPGVDTLVGGHDNLHFTEYTTPTLSSMEQPKQEMARAAVDMALMMIRAKREKKKLPTTQKIFTSRLIIRGSSQPLQHPTI